VLPSQAEKAAIRYRPLMRLTNVPEKTGNFAIFPLFTIVLLPCLCDVTPCDVTECSGLRWLGCHETSRPPASKKGRWP
jgi:hypothetical protein